jgi:hypothetical protein
MDWIWAKFWEKRGADLAFVPLFKKKNKGPKASLTNLQCGVADGDRAEKFLKIRQKGVGGSYNLRPFY